MKEHRSGPENSSDRLPPDNQKNKPDIFPDATTISEESAVTVPRFGLGDSDAHKKHEEKYSASPDSLELSDMPELSPSPELPDSDGVSSSEEVSLDALPKEEPENNTAAVEEPKVLLGEIIPDSADATASDKQDSSISSPPPGDGGSGNGGSGSGSGSGSGPEEELDPNAPRGGEQDLWSHLTELRARILYSIAAVALMSVVTWSFGESISEWFARPIRSALETRDVDFKLVTLNPTEGFLVYFQITVVSAILIVMPFILYQMWRFLEPALTRTERRFTQVLLPFSVLLFFLGCGLGYAVAPLFFRFFLLFQPPETAATFSYSSSIVLLAKMILVFGLCFQVPVVTIFLNKIGLISRNFLIDYWRHAVVLIFFIVAVLTPTWDPVTLIVCAGPPCLLYGLSIWIMKWL